jgi:hypothetical protein
LEFLRVPWLRVSLLEGLITSATGGSEGVVRASREAFADHLDSLQVESSTQSAVDHTLLDVCNCYLQLLRDNLANDRLLIPALEMLGFLFDTRIIQRLNGSSFQYVAAMISSSRWFMLIQRRHRSLLSLIQKAHFKSGNVSKLETAVKVYGGMTELPSLQEEATKKLFSMLVHPFAKVHASRSPAHGFEC